MKCGRTGREKLAFEEEIITSDEIEIKLVRLVLNLMCNLFSWCLWLSKCFFFHYYLHFFLNTGVLLDSIFIHTYMNLEFVSYSYHDYYPFIFLSFLWSPVFPLQWELLLVVVSGACVGALCHIYLYEKCFVNKCWWIGRSSMKHDFTEHMHVFLLKFNSMLM